MILYKYMNRKWARKFLKDGLILIGTLHQFQDEELHGTEVGDAKEGTKNVHSKTLKYIDTSNSSSIPYWMNQHINVSEPNQLIIHAKGGMSASYSDPNSYIYCVSDTYDQGAIKEMGYNCCIKIEDSDKFFKALSMKLKNKARFWGYTKCVYRSRSLQDWEDNVPASFIKESKHSHQKEVRGLWLPLKDEKIHPIVVKAKKATRLCHIFSI
ncbi:MAG: hypothetical protein COB79_03495 [Zetaproteobacteria bacterium]|nr:MAG: hypothetical protein COB79_03495 [Zetaproteobacteria bacterium]